MSRPLRIQYPGATYHIIARGNGGQNIFLNEKDYQLFLAVFFDCLNSFNWISYAYCLMPNHYHLLIETPDPNLSLGMRHMNGEYAQRFNIKHKRFGHLFQGRFKSILIQKQVYLYRVMRYIALNPVRAKLAGSPLVWKWGSYGQVIRGSNRPGCVDVNRVLKHFDPKSKAKARKAFKDYVGQKVDDDDPLKELRGGSVLGTMEFLDSIKIYLEGDRLEKDIPKRERFVERPDLLEIFSESDTMKPKERNRLIHIAHMVCGYSKSEIGRCLGLHNSTIGKIIRKEK